MTTVIELLDRRSEDTDGATLISARRGFYADLPANSVLSDGDVQEAIGNHNLGTGIELDRVLVTSAPDGFSYLTALYSTDGRFAGDAGSSSTVFEPTGDEWSWDITFADFTFEIPMLTRTVVDIPNADGGVDRQLTWEVTALEINQELPVLTLVTSASFDLTGAAGGLEIPTSLTAFQDIADQSGKLHTISGGQYKFRPENVSQQTRENWRVRYQWLLDTGTPRSMFPGVAGAGETNPGDDPSTGAWLPFTVDPEGPVSFLPSLADGETVWVRPPYRFAITTPYTEEVTGDELSLPFLEFGNDHRGEDVLGWTGLPGVFNAPVDPP